MGLHPYCCDVNDFAALDLPLNPPADTTTLKHHASYCSTRLCKIKKATKSINKPAPRSNDHASYCSTRLCKIKKATKSINKPAPRSNTMHPIVQRDFANYKKHQQACVFSSFNLSSLFRPFHHSTYLPLTLLHSVPIRLPDYTENGNPPPMASRYQGDQTNQG